jgi:hypothetical protein
MLKVVIGGETYKGEETTSFTLHIGEIDEANTNITFSQLLEHPITNLDCKIGNETSIVYTLKTKFNGKDITNDINLDAYHLDFNATSGNEQLETSFQLSRQGSQTLLIGSLSDSLVYTNFVDTENQVFPFKVSTVYLPTGANKSFDIEGGGNIVAKNTFAPGDYGDNTIVSAAVGESLTGNYCPAQNYTFNYHDKA